MITITIPKSDWFDEKTELFVSVEETSIVMEHSLVALRNWEAKWKVPFLHTEKNGEQLLDYLKMMTLTPDVPDVCYRVIPPEEMKRIAEYIKDDKTAMQINNRLQNGKKSNEFVSAETIYWWMITLGIPSEYETWHLERLLALIRFISIKNDPKKKKMSQKDVIQRNAEINKRNRERFGIKG